MVNYSNSDVIQCLRQYDMFSNSLKLVKNPEERSMIVKQLSKLEDKILNLTNSIYEEEYYLLVNKECELLDDEKKRLTMLIDLINQRLSYVEKRCNDHYQLTGDSINATDVLGANTLDTFENRVRIIDKYSKNIKLEKELKEDVKSLSSKIALTSEKMEINRSLNLELENTFKSIINSAFEKLGLYTLLDIKDEIDYAYYEIEKSLTLAELNLETAKTSSVDILNECQEMLQDIRKDYLKYKENLSILKLMEIFNRDVDSYEELLSKRKEVNEVLKHIKNEEFLNMVMDTITKQFNTIVMEQQDINTLNDLTLEKERKLEALAEIDEENNSGEFQNVLNVLLENEQKKKERLLEEQKKIEEEEKKKQIEIERKKQEEILKRQKIIEEARKKEIEKRTKVLLEQQQNSVLQTKKKDNLTDKEIKDDISKTSFVEMKKEKDKIVPKKKDDEEEEKKDFSDIKLELDKTEEELFDVEKKETTPVVKNKDDIEKELFDEFDSFINKEEENNEDESYFMSEDSNKLPNVSIDEYMKNFDENDVDNVDNLFADDIFPSIPM